MPTNGWYGMFIERGKRALPPWLQTPKGFKGKKAAPFKKGGGRKMDHPNTAKGTPRKKGR